MAQGVKTLRFLFLGLVGMQNVQLIGRSMVEAFFDRESSEVSANPSVIRKYIVNVCTKFEITNNCCS